MLAEVRGDIAQVRTGDTVLTVIEEGDHAIGVHGLASVL